jgi:hypothetical protein
MTFGIVVGSGCTGGLDMIACRWALAEECGLGGNDEISDQDETKTDIHQRRVA